MVLPLTGNAILIKSLVEDVTGVRVSDQQLLCNGKVLLDTAPLSMCSIQNGDTIRIQ